MGREVRGRRRREGLILGKGSPSKVLLGMLTNSVGSAGSSGATVLSFNHLPRASCSWFSTMFARDSIGFSRARTIFS